MRLLETHACQGGATAGYMRAGWDVTTVDIDHRHAKYNPSQHKVLGDAAEYIAAHGHEYDAIHASPPCQWYTRGNASRRGQESKWERSIPAIREAILTTGKPYVIENVKDAAFDLIDPIMLCGCMFGLSTIDTDGVRIHLQRQRLFEANWRLVPGRLKCDHSQHEWVAGAYGGARRDKYEARYVRRGGYVPREKEVVKALLGVEHDMTWNGLYECLPPAYTEWIGFNLALHIKIEREKVA